MTVALTTEQFVEKARKVHGNKYDYSKVVYVTSQRKVVMVCPPHGEFITKPNNHLNGQGCPQCAKENIRERKLLTTQEFVDASKKVHGDRYDYSSSEYTGAKQKITVSCLAHGPFSQTADSHMRGIGCPSCAKEVRRQKKRRPFARFVDAAIEQHGEKYEYFEDDYVSMREPTAIACPLHGVFYQVPQAHIVGVEGCPDCALSGRRTSTEEFIERSTKVHNGRYDYSLTEVSGVNNKVKIMCPIHGEFEQAASSHMRGYGCWKCNTSAEEYELKHWLESLGVRVLMQNRNLIGSHEIDLYLPDQKIAIEYCGLYWHRTSDIRKENYHREKMLLCREQGIRLFTVFSDEWATRKRQVRSVLRNAVLKTKPTTIAARKLKAVEIEKDAARTALEDWHLQGYVPASLYLGLVDAQETLLAVAGFSVPRTIYGSKYEEGTYELVRYAEHPEVKVLGGLEKLLSAFSKTTQDSKQILSYVDLRWFTGSSLIKAGFNRIRESVPGYFYFKGNKRYTRFSFAKHRLEKRLKIYDPEKTERQNMLANKYCIIHDCGTGVYLKAL